MFDCNRNIHPTGLSFWRRQKAVSLTKPITRCPDAPEEEGEPDPDGGDEGSPEGKTTSYVEWCPTHERLLQVCQTLLLASDACAPTNAWCEIHLRERTICEEAPTLTPSEEPFAPIFPLTNGTFTLSLDGAPGSFELERRPKARGFHFW